MIHARSRRLHGVALVVCALLTASCTGGQGPSGPGAGAVQIATESPDHGPAAGGNVVEVAGQGFAPGAAILFDGVPSASVTVRSARLLAAVAPAHAPGRVGVDVVMPDGSRAHRDDCYDYVEAPVVSSIDPGQVPPAGGVAVVILGTGFQPGATVRFGDLAAQGSQWVAAERLTAVTPAHAAGRADVQVTNPDGQVGTLPAGLTYADPVVTPPAAEPPTLTGASPASGPTAGATQVTLAGTGFATGLTVRFGATPATVSSVQSTQIVVVTPPSASGPADVVVTNPDGQVAVLTAGFSFVAPPPPAPTIASVAPTSGPDAGGTPVVIGGTGFQPGATVTVGGLAATVLGTPSATSIAVTTPAHPAGAADVVVTNPDKQTATLPAGFTYLAPPAPPPTLASVSPASGPTAGGTAVTLTGTGFQASAAVTVGGVAATVGPVSATSISINTPPHAPGAADVVVTNPDRQKSSLPAAFTYLGPAPTLAVVTPTFGPTAGGNSVTLTGTGFDAGTTVLFAGVPVAPASVASRSATSLTVLAPAHAAGAVDVTVKNADGQTAALPGAYAYRLPAPSVASVSPASGPDAGNTTLTVTGTGFVSGTTVNLGGAAALASTVVSPTSMVATTTAHLPGAVDVVVTNPDGQAGTLAAGFTFLAAPAVASLTPASGPAAGGTTVTATGSGFRAGAAVTLGGAAVTGLVVASPTALIFTTPAHAAGAADLVVTNSGDARAATLAAAFTYVAAPAVAGVSPSSGPTAGGTAVTVSGSGFQPGAAVTLGASAVVPSSVTATAITLVAPAHGAGAGDLLVMNPDGQKATAPGAFTWIEPPAIAGLTPGSGPAAGGTAITVTGTGFQPGASVTLGGSAVAAPTVTAASIAFAAPAHAAGLADLVVVNPDGQRTTRAAAFGYVAGPSISAVSPASGPAAGGKSLVVTGAGFQAGAAVTVGGTAAAVASLTATSIALTAPAHAAGLVDVVVANLDGQTATKVGAFTYVAPPTVAGFSPATGSTAGGTVVTLTGTGFSGPSVTVGGAAAALSTSSATSITFTTPAGAAGPAAVVVTNADGQGAAAATPFTYVAPPPSIASVSPTTGPTAGGTSVVIAGANFSGASVAIGGLPAPVTAGSATSLSATAPAHAAGAADVVVTNADGQKATLAAGFTYRLPAPTLASLAPVTGPTTGGTAVTVTGSGFQAGATATLGGAAATGVTVASATSLSFVAPAGTAGPAALVVTNPDGQLASLAAAFTYVLPALPPPAFAGLAPPSGPAAGGTAVTVTGTGFAVGASVMLGGTPVVGVAVAAAGTSITFTTPPHGAGPAALVVTNPDGQTTGPAGSFTFVAPPAPAAVAPAAGPIAGGTVLTVTGTGFQAGASVLVGGLPATLVAVASSTALSAVAPPHAAGPVDVVVANPDGQQGTLAAAFTYRAPAPAIASLAPAAGPDAGGTTVVVSGSGFAGTPAVTFGGAPALVLSASPAALTVSTPVHPAGVADVTVTNLDGQSATATAAFTFLPPPPAIAAVTPASGSTAGATAVTISGTGFRAGAAVSVGGAPAAVGLVSPTSIAISTPPHAAGPADVVVTNPDGQKATLAAAFTFVPPPPAIAGIAPASGPTAGGTLVTLTGSAFQPGATVTVGGTAATVGTVSATSIGLTTPPHAFGAADVVVTNPDGQKATLPGAFTYVAPAPTFVGVLPASGPTAGGSALTLSGTGFLSGATVAVGGVLAPATVSSATTIAVTAPPHASGAVNVVVTNPDGKSVTGTAAYTYLAPAPTLAAVAPAVGPVAGGAALTLTGTGFLPGATVTVGGLSAPVATSSATSIAVTAPAHAAGAADVVVANPDGQTASLPGAFTYRLPAPAIAGVAPSTGLTTGGTTVTVTGSGFQVGAAVALGGAAAAGVSVAGSTSLSFAAPPHAAGPAALVVTNPDGQQATLAAAFTYLLPPPLLLGVSPGTGPDVGGTTAVLSGTGFQPGASATFGGVAALVLSTSPTSITVTTPAHGAGLADVAVTNPDGQSSTLAGAFTFTGPPPPPVPPPAPVSISPLGGPDAGGTTVVVAGANFQLGATVTVGGLPAAVLSVTSTAISITTPPHAAGPADVVVTNPDGQKATLAAAFTFVAPPPAVATIAPASGPGAGGTALVVTGSGFQPVASVTVGGAAAAVTASSATSLTVTTPPHAPGAVPVVVTNPDGQKATAATLFTYLAPPPVIATVAPATGSTAGGTPVLVAGTGFQAGATVTLGGTAVAAPAVTATSIAFTTPAHAAGSAALVVTNPDGQSATLGAAFTFVTPPPALVSVAPASGSTLGGTLVTVTGSGFQTGAAVAVGATPAAGVAVASSTSLTFTAPAHAAGAVAVTVTNPDGQSASLPAAFAYVAPPPVLAAFAPASGPVAGGTAATLTGSGFQPGAAVSLGGSPATVVSVSATSIAITTPPHAAGLADVVVTNPDGQSATLAGSFRYLLPPPAIATVSPPSGPTAGGTLVTVAGSGFQAGAAVTLGGAPVAATVTAASITFATPAHAAGAVALAVANPDGQSASVAAAFTFVAPPVLASVTPASGSTLGGTTVALAGSGFAASATVTVGGLPAAVLSVTSTAISITTPPHAAGPADVVVTNPDGQKATLAAAFTFVAPPPAVATIAPASGPTAGGTVITVAGSAFQAGASVTVGGLAATVTAASASSLTALAPAHAAGAADVVVTNPDGQKATAIGVFTFVAPPVLATVAPGTGSTLGGTAVALGGTGFQAGATVLVGGAAATVGPVTGTSIAATTAAHAAGVVAVTVTNPDGQSSTLASAFTYAAPPPAIAAVAPTSGPIAGGTVVTVTGSAFQTGAAVSIGGSAGLAVSATATTITFTTPAHAAGPATLVVANPDGQAATLASAFAFVAPPPPAPSIASLAPASGPTAGGTAVAVTGASFQAGATATLGGLPAAVGAVTATTLALTAPAHAAGPADLVVTNPDGQRATAVAAFTYVAPPSLLSVAPSSGPAAGGTLAVLTGTGFQAGAAVTVGGAAALVGTITATNVAFTTPAHAPGATDLVVTNPDGQKATLAAAFTYVAAPTLALVAPASGPAAGGTALTLTGTGFQAGAAVTVGGAAATVGAVTATTIAVTSPPRAAGAADVVVTNPDGQKATLAAAFTYVAAPTIALVAPASGPAAGGTVLNLSGTAFQAGAAVTVGGTAATAVAVTATSITATTPAHAAGAADVVVTNPDGQKATAAAAFTFVAAPAIVAITPATGLTTGGTAATVTGSAFRAGAAVTVGGVAAAVGAVTPGSISLTTPAHAAGAADVVVTNPDGQKATLAGGFVYAFPAPVLASLAPASGPAAGGNAVTLTGSAFRAGATVTFGGVAAAVGSVAATTIAVTAPPHAAGAVDVVVTNSDGQRSTLAAAYTYLLPAPTVASVTPASGPDVGATVVTIAGTGFQAGATVTFGAASATGVVVTAASITATTPAHAAGPVDVVVLNPDGQSAALLAGYRYLLPAPTIAAVAPTSGPAAGGTTVTVTGTGFQAGATATVGGTAATVTAFAATSLTLVTPPGAAGAATVAVSNPDGQTASLAAAFAYVAPPAITSVTPATGSIAGGTVVTVGGTGFQAGATVTVGGTAATGVAVTATSVTATTPAHAAGAADVVVTNPDGQKATATAAFTFTVPATPAPTLASITPNQGSTAGGTTVVTVGTNFVAGATVSVGGVPAAVTGLSATAISCTTGAHAAGAVDVVVTNPDGQSATLAGAYTYVVPAPPPGTFPPPTLSSVSPASGLASGGEVLSLGGTNFQLGATVVVGGISAPVTAVVVGGGALTAIAPAHAAGPVDVTVVNPDGQSVTLAASFTYLPLPALPPPACPPTAPPGTCIPPPTAPTVTAIAPTTGATTGGDVVTITGTNFDPAALVTFDTAFATIVTTSPTSIFVQTPPHAAGLVSVTVINPDGWAAVLPASFSYAVLAPKPPKTKSITPASGYESGGNIVSIAGTDFVVGAVVKFGGTAVLPFGVRSTRLDVFAPPHAPGLVDVTVTNPDGQSATLTAAYTFVALPPVLPAPTVTSITPISGPVAGGTSIGVAGTNFVAGTKVFFDGVQAVVTGFTGTAITATTPAHPAPGFVDVTVVNPDGQVATLPGAFLYLGAGPVINTVSPHACPMAGGVTVLVAGINIQPGATVTFGGVPGIAPSWDPLNKVLSVVTPPGPGGIEAFVNVVVTNPDGLASPPFGQFRYGPPPVVTGFTPTTIIKGKVQGQAMTISGTDFSVPSTGAGRFVQILVGPNLATLDPALPSTPTTLHVILPAITPGSYRVIVTNFDGQFGAGPGVFFLPGP